MLEIGYKASAEQFPAADVLIREPIRLLLRDSVAAPPGHRPARAVPLQRAPGRATG